MTTVATASLDAILTYDKHFGLESDAFAAFEHEQLHEPGDYVKAKAICVNPVWGQPDTEFYVCAREARVLAAQLLRAADDQEEAAKKPYGEPYTVADLANKKDATP